MNIRDREGWDSLVYKMLYPGILGSMGYALAFMWWEDSYCSLFIAQVILVLFYCFDYLHLHRDLLEREDHSNSLWDLLLDAAIALLFCVTSCFILHKKLLMAWIFLSALPVIMCFYMLPNRIVALYYRISIGILAFLVFIFGGILGYIWNFRPGCYFPILCGFCAFVYFLHVFYITEHIKIQDH